MLTVIGIILTFLGHYVGDFAELAHSREPLADWPDTLAGLCAVVKAAGVVILLVALCLLIYRYVP